MLKKLAALLLSLLLCLSLLPGQARAESLPDSTTPSITAEPLDPETPEEPEEPLLPQEEVPGTNDKGHSD